MTMIWLDRVCNSPTDLATVLYRVGLLARLQLQRHDPLLGGAASVAARPVDPDARRHVDLPLQAEARRPHVLLDVRQLRHRVDGGRGGLPPAGRRPPAVARSDGGGGGGGYGGTGGTLQWPWFVVCGGGGSA